MIATHLCPLCGTSATTSICDNCAQDLDALDVPLPDPAWTPEQVRAWGVEHKVTAFRCNPTEAPAAPPPPPIPRGRDVPLLFENKPLPMKPPGRR